MKWKIFKLIIQAIVVIGMLMSILAKEVNMAIFFMLALILNELEEIGETLKGKS